jgi:hypothetical protein
VYCVATLRFGAIDIDGNEAAKIICAAFNVSSNAFKERSYMIAMLMTISSTTAMVKVTMMVVVVMMIGMRIRIIIT